MGKNAGQCGEVVGGEERVDMVSCLEQIATTLSSSETETRTLCGGLRGREGEERQGERR